MNSKLEFEIPSWEQIYGELLNLANRIRENNFKTDVIMNVSRGGWFPERIMFDLLENPKLANMRVCTSRWFIFSWERKETFKPVLEKYENQGKSVDENVEKLVQSGPGRKLVERFVQEISGELT